MKKVLTYHMATTSIVYIICYLIYSFITWEVVNPFQWVLDLPNEAMSHRAAVLMTFILWHMIGIGVWSVQPKD